MTLNWKLCTQNPGWFADVAGLGRYVIRFSPNSGRYVLSLNSERLGSFLTLAGTQDRAQRGADFHQREAQP